MQVSLVTRRSTKKLAECLAKSALPGDVFFLEGDLGVGKTFFVRAFARALGLHKDTPLTSPTFAILQEVCTTPPLLHGDLYRLADASELFELGLASDENTARIVLLEWAERFRETISNDGLLIRLRFREGAGRDAELFGFGARGEALLHAVTEHGFAESKPENSMR